MILIYSDGCDSENCATVALRLEVTGLAAARRCTAESESVPDQSSRVPEVHWHCTRHQLLQHLVSVPSRSQF